MSSPRVKVLVAGALLWAWWWLARRGGPGDADDGTPSGGAAAAGGAAAGGADAVTDAAEAMRLVGLDAVMPMFRRFESLAPEHYARAGKRLQAFKEALDTNRNVFSLHALRAGIMEDLRALRMRLPNDLAAEKAAASMLEAVDATLAAYVDFARSAARARGATVPMYVPPPLGTWRSTGARAANDVVA